MAGEFHCHQARTAWRNTETTGGPSVIRYAQTNIFRQGDARALRPGGSLRAAEHQHEQPVPRPVNRQSTAVALDPAKYVQQAHVGIYQDDDNYVDVGLVFNSGLGGEAVTFVSRRMPFQPLYSDVFWFTGGPGSPAQTNIFLRLGRDPATSDRRVLLAGWPGLGVCGEIQPVASSIPPWESGSAVLRFRPPTDCRFATSPVGHRHCAAPGVELSSQSAGGRGDRRWQRHQLDAACQADASLPPVHGGDEDMASRLSATNSFLVTVTAAPARSHRPRF